MTDRTKLLISNVLVAAALVLAGITIYGMLQTPRPDWTRGLGPISLMCAIVANVLRRRVRRAREGGGGGAP